MTNERIVFLMLNGLAVAVLAFASPAMCKGGAEAETLYANSRRIFGETRIASTAYVDRLSGAKRNYTDLSHVNGTLALLSDIDEALDTLNASIVDIVAESGRFAEAGDLNTTVTQIVADALEGDAELVGQLKNITLGVAAGLNLTTKDELDAVKRGYRTLGDLAYTRSADGDEVNDTLALLSDIDEAIADTVSELMRNGSMVSNVTVFGLLFAETAEGSGEYAERYVKADALNSSVANAGFALEYGTAGDEGTRVARKSDLPNMSSYVHKTDDVLTGLAAAAGTKETVFSSLHVSTHYATKYYADGLVKEEGEDGKLRDRFAPADNDYVSSATRVEYDDDDEAAGDAWKLPTVKKVQSMIDAEKVALPTFPPQSADPTSIIAQGRPSDAAADGKVYSCKYSDAHFAWFGGSHVSSTAGDTESAWAVPTVKKVQQLLENFFDIRDWPAGQGEACSS